MDNKETSNKNSKPQKQKKSFKSVVGKIARIVFSFPVGLALLAFAGILLFVDYKTSLLNINRTEMKLMDYYESPSAVCVSNSGKIAVVDNKKRILLLDGDYSKSITIGDIGYNSINARIWDVCFDNNDNLYFYYSVFDEDSYVTLYDKIGKIDQYGEYTDDIVTFDYSSYDPYYKRTTNLYGLHYDNNAINFLYRENDFEFSEYSYSLKNDGYEVLSTYEIDEFETVVTGCYAKENGYAVIMNNGDIAYIKDGEYTKLVNDEFEIGKNVYYDFFPQELGYCNDTLYVLSGAGCEDIVKITGNDYEFECTLEDITEEFDMYDIFDNFDYLNVHLFDNNGKLGLVYCDAIIYDINDPSMPYDEGFRNLPFKELITNIFIGLLGLLEYSSLILGIIISIGGFVKWKMNILAKQLLFTLPPIIIAFAVFTLISIYNIGTGYIDSTYDKMDTISYIASLEFDAEELKEIKNYDFVNEGTAFLYHLKLRDILANNKEDWSKKYEIKLQLIDYSSNEMGFMEIASSSSYTKPFYKYSFSADDSYGEPLNLKNPGIGKAQMTFSDSFMNYELYDRSIFDKNGNLIAVLEVSTDNSDIEEMLNTIIIKNLALMGLFIAILISLISIVTYFNVKKIQSASNTVSEIAKGDFKIRIKKTGKDEIGDICRGVNDMAEKLDTMFKEKDENEQFYYKFVPEQFKDLLHKKKFTELNLGDAESVNLTVLFCDIRSFSINSEMMTAKENFEFINVIYGIAGPIIRKHNGFVDKYIGDAVMALFEKADDAVRCGEELYNEIVLNPETLDKINLSSIDIGIGIHTGMARIGIVGEEERMSGTVISNTVNLSSRLESLTKQYNTAMIITKDTLDSMDDPDSLNLRYLGMIQVAGVNEVKALYEVLDCLDEKRMVNRNRTKNEFREAVRLYHLGKLEEAVELFESIKPNAEEDPAIETYINYIKEMIENHKTDINVFKFNKK